MSRFPNFKNVLITIIFFVIDQYSHIAYHSHKLVKPENLTEQLYCDTSPREESEYYLILI